MAPTASTPPIYDSAPLSNTAQVEQSSTGAPEPDGDESVKAADLQYRIDQIIKKNEAKDITTSVSLYALENNRSLVQHNNETAQFAASINKLPVALLLLEDLRSGKITLSEQVTWQPEDVRSGFGVYDQPDAAQQASVGDVLYDMLNNSGNTAVRVLVNYKLAGPQAINDRLDAIPEIRTTRLEVLAPESFFLGNSTSAESVWIMHTLLGNPQDEYYAFIKAALETNIFSYYGVRSQLEGSDYVVIANKVGILDDVDGNNRHDVGIIYNTKTNEHYGYSFMTTAASGNITGTAQAEHSLDLFGRATLRYAGDKPVTNNQRSLEQGRFVSPETRVRY